LGSHGKALTALDRDQLRRVGAGSAQYAQADFTGFGEKWSFTLVERGATLLWPSDLADGAQTME
jgi:hypothetical protein